MHEIMVPKEIKFSDVSGNYSLSPNNFKQLMIKNNNQTLLESFLNHDLPFEKGKEPGSGFYVKKSKQIFLRNSCINNLQFSLDMEKYIFLNPNYYDDNMVKVGDVLLCTDANIGDCCLCVFEEQKIIFSSGIVKLNFSSEKEKYYVFAFLKDDYFRRQLDAKTPKGSTIRHSGDLFMKCNIPIIDSVDEWIFDAFECLVKNIAYTEHICESKLRKSETIINDELMKKEYDYINTDFDRTMDTLRLDSGIYSNKVFQWKNNVLHYKNGYKTLEEYGFKLKRGPNLAKRDLGRSIQSDKYIQGYNVLIYPSDISSSGYISSVSYLGARNPIWFLGEKDILFASEGTIGKTFIICDTKMKFTTNFHGTIVSPISKNQEMEKSIFLGLYLNYLRSKGIFDKISVGGNGGSFAVGYWDNIIIPVFSKNLLGILRKLYDNVESLNPLQFDLEKIKQAGIYQLNEFLIVCKELLKAIRDDIKNDEVKSKTYYETFSS